MDVINNKIEIEKLPKKKTIIGIKFKREKESKKLLYYLRILMGV